MIPRARISGLFPSVCVLLLLAPCFVPSVVAATVPGGTPAVESNAAQLAAAPGVTRASPINSGDNAWLLASTALVLMMTAPGLVLFYGGLVRSKNVLSTMMHSLVLMAV